MIKKEVEEGNPLTHNILSHIRLQNVFSAGGADIGNFHRKHWSLTSTHKDIQKLQQKEQQNKADSLYTEYQLVCVLPDALESLAFTCKKSLNLSSKI